MIINYQFRLKQTKDIRLRDLPISRLVSPVIRPPEIYPQADPIGRAYQISHGTEIGN